VCSVADRLWKELLGGEKSVKAPLGFTHVGLAFHGIEVVAAGQQHISGFFQTSNRVQDEPTSVPHKRKRSTSVSSKRTKSPSAVPEEVIDMTSVTEISDNIASWKCRKCWKTITIDEMRVDDNDPAEQLTKLVMIHEDGHFAESLSASLNGASPSPSPSTSTIKSPYESARSHKSVRKKGLLQFFERK
jgi:hypothetical protein